MNPPSRPHRPDSFTLVEMLLVLLVFMVICGAVFGIVTNVLQNASSLKNHSDQRDQIIALQAYLQKHLAEQPAQSALNYYVIGDGDDWTKCGVIFGRDDLELTAIDATAQNHDGTYTLRLATYTPDPLAVQSIVAPRQAFQESVSKDDPTLNWVTLISNVKSIHWQFQDYNQTDWLEIWGATTQLPNTVQLSLELADDSQPIVLDFWLPRVQPPTFFVFSPGGRQVQLNGH